MRSTFVLIALMGFMSVQSFAAHDDWDYNPGRGMGTSIGHRSANLNRSVQYSSLSWRVKKSVRKFNYAAQRYARCQGRGGYFAEDMNAEITLENKDLDFEDIVLESHDDLDGPSLEAHPRGCRGAYNKMMRRFRRVDHFLNDTYNDYPYIYRLFQNVRNSIY